MAPSQLLLCIVAAMACSAHPIPAHAGKTYLWAQSYPPSSLNTQPTQATFTINDGSNVNCVVLVESGGPGYRQPRCDLALLTRAGMYTLVMTVYAGDSSQISSCTSSTNVGSCTFGGGQAVSAPFYLKVSKPNCFKPNTATCSIQQGDITVIGGQP